MRNYFSGLWNIKLVFFFISNLMIVRSTAISYNERGWLKSSNINEFSIQLDYQENEGNQWNGNIST